MLWENQEMAAKINSYQKQKAMIIRLQNDIHTLVTKAETLEGMTLAMSYRMKFDMLEKTWFGNAPKKDGL